MLINLTYRRDCYMIECVAIKERQDLLGCVVISKQGRDINKPGVIVGWLPDDFALVADGRRRPVSRPKKKNMKHLAFMQCRPGGLFPKIPAGEQITDQMVREGLAAFGEQTGEGRPYGKK